MLFQLRFQTGEMFPPYSSFRADPLGSMALYESLLELDAIDVQRQLEPVSTFQDWKDTTLLFAGSPTTSARGLNLRAAGPASDLLTVPVTGGRIVFCLLPMDRVRQDEDDETVKDNSEPLDKDNGKPIDEDNGEPLDENNGKPIDEDLDIESEDLASSTLAEKLNLELKHNDAIQDAPPEAYLTGTETHSEFILPATVPWHSRYYFRIPDEGNWQTVYERDAKPVVIEKRIGKGSIVLATDSYLLSNEAMRNDRQPGWLCWLLGNNEKVRFSEYHLGIVSTRGTAVLMRELGLHGFFVALVVLGILFVWKNATSLVPSYRSEELAADFHHASEKDYYSGLVNLLRRGIPSTRIVQTALDEWKRSFSRRKDFDEIVLETQQLLETQEHEPKKKINPVEAYRKICSILSK